MSPRSWQAYSADTAAVSLVAECCSVNRISIMEIDFSSRITHHFGAGVYAKETRLHKDEVFTQHKHNHDHISILASGCVAVEVDGQTEIYGAPACILIKAGAHHKVVGMMDSTWFCIHATDETDPKRVDQSVMEA